MASHVVDLPQDLRDLLIELHDAGAEFVVVGGYAVAFHGHPRATKDLDILVRAAPDNAARVYRALAAFGAPLSNFEVSETDFATYDGVLQIGLPPRRIDILNRATGITTRSQTGRRSRSTGGPFRSSGVMRCSRTSERRVESRTLLT